MTDNNRILIDIPSDGSYIEILGYKIDGYDSFEAFCEHLNKYAELEETVSRQKAEIERLENKVKGFEKIRRAYQRFIYESMPNIQTALDKVLKELVGENDEKI